ncbi:MAG: nuclear transport factor 2 family protein [Actinomycetota bacterium]|nr:nuclear transport factor 2 family protein [Actinomycetota bacterium]
MSERESETVRRLYERWSQGDFSAGAQLFDDATVFILSPDFPDAGIYLGAAGISRYMRGFLEPWERLTITCLGLVQVGDTVVAEVRQEGAGELSGAMTGFEYFQIWSFRGGTLMRLENVMHREEADAAVGGRLG